MSELIDSETGEVMQVQEVVHPGLDAAVDTYIKLRDKKAALKKEQSAVLKKYDDAMAELGAELKDLMAKLGVTAISCGSGTAYTKRQRSATVADTHVFREYVIANNNFDLADFRARVEAVEDFVREHDGQLPPGTNFTVREIVVVNRK